MTNVLPLFARPETLEQFIRRDGGVTNTSNVARRFGWGMEEARKALRKLEREGRLTKRLVRNPDSNGSGSAYDWHLVAD